MAKKVTEEEKGVLCYLNNKYTDLTTERQKTAEEINKYFNVIVSRLKIPQNAVYNFETGEFSMPEKEEKPKRSKNGKVKDKELAEVS